MPLSVRSATNLAILIQAIAESSTLLEKSRQCLAQQQLFDPQSAFKRIDQDRHGQLSEASIADFLIDNKIGATKDELRALFLSIDSKHKGVLDYEDFVHFIMGREASPLRPQSYVLKRNTLLPYEVEWALSKVFEQQLQNIRIIGKAQRNLIDNIDFSHTDCVTSIDVDNLGHISLHNLIDFTKSAGIFISVRDLEILHRELDPQGKGRVSYEFFMERILPSVETQRKPYVDSEVRKKRQEFLQAQSRTDDSIQDAYQRSQQVIAQLRQGRQNIEKKFDASKRDDSSNTQMRQQSRIYHTPKKRNYGDIPSTKRTTPLKGNEESHLVHALHEMVIMNNELEDLKRQLANRMDFHPSSAFALLDKYDRNQLNKLDFEMSCMDLSVYPSKDQIFLLFQHYSPYSAFITYRSFLPIVLPQSEEYSTTMLANQEKQSFSTQTMQLFITLLNKHFCAESQAENLRQKLKKRPLFSTSQAFYAVDKDEQGFITIDQFSHLFEEHKIRVTAKDLEGLVRTFDRNLDGKVSFSEFIHQMSPKRL